MLHDILTLDQQWLPNKSNFPPISWPWYRAWPSPNYEWFPWSICNGCGMPAGNAYPSGQLVQSPISGLACAPIVETRFLELVISLLDFSPRIPLGTFSIFLQLDIKYLPSVCVVTLNWAIGLDITGSWPLKTRRWQFNKRFFSTPNWRYMVTVGNAIRNDQLLQALGWVKIIYLLKSSVIIRIECLLLSIYWRINVRWRVTNYPQTCSATLCRCTQFVTRHLTFILQFTDKSKHSILKYRSLLLICSLYF